MEDKLKTYIMTHRDQLDIHQSSDLWSKINQQISQPSSPALKNTSNILKKGLWGSGMVVVATLATYLLLNKQEGATASVALPAAPAEIKAKKAVIKTEPAMAGSTIVSGIPPNEQPENNGIVSENKSADTTTSIPVKQPAALIPNEQPTVPVEQTAYYPATPKTIIDSNSVFTGIKRVVVKGDFFDVNVNGQAGDEVTLHKEFSITSKGISTEVESNYEIVAEKNDSVLNVYIKYKSRNVFTIGTSRMTALLDFKVPSATNVIVENSSGDIKTNGLSGKVIQLETASGNIASSQMTALTATTVSGDVSLTDIKGNLKVETSSGNQRLKNITGNVKLESVSGDLILSNLAGDAATASSSGNQNFTNATGNINSSSVSGDITLDNAKGTYSLETSSGNIRGVKTQLTASSEMQTISGDIVFDLVNPVSELSFDLKSISGDLIIKKDGTNVREENKVLVKQGPVMIKAMTASGNQVFK